MKRHAPQQPLRLCRSLFYLSIAQVTATSFHYEPQRERSIQCLQQARSVDVWTAPVGQGFSAVAVEEGSTVSFVADMLVRRGEIDSASRLLAERVAYTAEQAIGDWLPEQPAGR